MTRRELIALLALTAAAGLTGCRPSRHVRERAEQLLALVERRDDAAAIGRSWIEELPAEPRLKELVDEVESVLGESEGDLAGAVRADFAAGRTARAQAWVLSRTELRLAAIAALVASP